MSRSMSLLTLAAVMSGIMLAIGIIAYGPASSFMSVEGLVIVVGGSIANAFLSFRRDDVRKAFSTIRHMLSASIDGRERLRLDILRFIDWAYIVQQQDFIGLEKEGAKSRLEPLMRYGMDLTVTGYSAAIIRDMMHTVADAEFEQGCAPVTVLRNMAATAPAFGMVGTLVGMILLLRNVGLDISNLGSGLGVAMLSTLYGILAARLVCLPAADKLLQQEETTRFSHYMLAEGFAMLAEKHSPYYMLDRLNSFLTPSKHFDLLKFERSSIQPSLAVAA